MTSPLKILMTERKLFIMPEKTPEQQIEELKTSIGAMAEMISMFYSTLISKGIDEAAAMFFTGSFIQAFTASTFGKGNPK